MVQTNMFVDIANGRHCEECWHSREIDEEFPSVTSLFCHVPGGGKPNTLTYSEWNAAQRVIRDV
jgi:hypothetical protein